MAERKAYARQIFPGALERDNNSLERSIGGGGGGGKRKKEDPGFTKAAAISGRNMPGMRGRHRNGSGVQSGFKKGASQPEVIPRK